MTLETMAQFLDEHPGFAPHFALGIKGTYFVDGFTTPDGDRHFSPDEIKRMLAAKPRET